MTSMLPGVFVHVQQPVTVVMPHRPKMRETLLGGRLKSWVLPMAWLSAGPCFFSLNNSGWPDETIYSLRTIQVLARNPQATKNLCNLYMVGRLPPDGRPDIGIPFWHTFGFEIGLDLYILDVKSRLTGFGPTAGIDFSPGGGAGGIAHGYNMLCLIKANFQASHCVYLVKYPKQSENVRLRS